MTWLTVKKVASLFDVTERTIQINLKHNKYHYRYVDGIGRGGQVLQISLESLPQETQDLYSKPFNYFHNR